MDETTAVAVLEADEQTVEDLPEALSGEVVADTTDVQPDDGTGPRRQRLEWIDPRDLLSNPRNVREDLGDLTELRDSIAENGVWHALLGVPDEDGITIVDGHRRAAAAVQAIEDPDVLDDLAREVPVLVDPALAGKTSEQIAAMLGTSIHRKGLTVSEEAAGYHQLTLEGWTTDQIAKRLARRKEHVAASLVLAQQSGKIQQAVNKGDLNLEDAAALAEFDNDPKALARILNKGSSWAVRNQIADERRKRRIAETASALHAELTEAGVVIINKPKDFPYRCREAEVSTLRSPDGEVMLPSEVRAQPGFAAFIDTAGAEAKAVVVCLNPEAHGFTRRSTYGGYVPPEEAARKEEQRAAEEARQAALDTAAEVRQQFLAETYGSAKAAKPLYVEVLRATVADPRFIEDGKRSATLVTALTGTDPEVVTLAEAGEARLTRFLVGLWIAGQEANLHALIRERWGAKRKDALAWLDRLVATGYDLSDAEQEMHGEWTAEEAALCAECGADPDEYHADDCSHYNDDEQDDDEPDEEDEPDGPYAVAFDAELAAWHLYDPTGNAIACNPQPDATPETVTAWAAGVLHQDHGHLVTGWRTETDPDFGDRLVAEIGGQADDAEASESDDDEASDEDGASEPDEDDAEAAATDERELIAA